MPDGLEVEKKFFPTPTLVSKLQAHADSITETRSTDTYYDTNEYFLTTKNWWLRRRANTYQLKTPPQGLEEIKGLQTYDEAETQTAVEERLGIGELNEQTLKQNGYNPFLTITNERMKLCFGTITVCIDTVYDNTKLFEIAEAERIITDPANIHKAHEELIAFGDAYSIPFLEQPPKKIVAFLKDTNPQHFNALIHNNVVKKEAYNNVVLTQR